MSLVKKTVIDQIMVIEDGTVFCREATTILEDGVEISKKYHRTNFYPGQDLTGWPDNVVAICNAAWTPEVVAAYQQQITKSEMTE